MSESNHFVREILCIGNINMDLVMTMERLPERKETVLAETFNTYPGGKGGNQAVTVARFGGLVSMFSKLGMDQYSRELKKTMQNKGVNVNPIIECSGLAAGIAMIMVDSNGNNLISYTRGGNANFTPVDIEKKSDLFQPGHILMLTLEVPFETVTKAIMLAKEKDMFVILDPSPVPLQTFSSELARCVDLIKPNEVESSALTGIEIVDSDSAVNAAYRLRELGFKTPVITLGAEGIVACEEGNIIKIPARKVDVKDTTAAGDVFSGVLATCISKNIDLNKSLHYANTAAALSTTKVGAQTSIPSPMEVEQYDDFQW